MVTHQQSHLYKSFQAYSTGKYIKIKARLHNCQINFHNHKIFTKYTNRAKQHLFRAIINK